MSKKVDAIQKLQKQGKRVAFVDVVRMTEQEQLDIVQERIEALEKKVEDLVDKEKQAYPTPPLKPHRALFLGTTHFSIYNLAQDVAELKKDIQYICQEADKQMRKGSRIPYILYRLNMAIDEAWLIAKNTLEGGEDD